MVLEISSCLDEMALFSVIAYGSTSGANVFVIAVRI